VDLDVEEPFPIKKISIEYLPYLHLKVFYVLRNDEFAWPVVLEYAGHGQPVQGVFESAV
jgi:hypothetical protein